MKAEPVFWLLIFILTAYLIAKNTDKRRFLHGLFLGIANCIWITAVHGIWFHTYLANHPTMAQSMADMPLSGHPLRQMLLIAPFIGVVSGVVIGLFALIAARLVRK
jgi:hypothetical protein